ncbi:MAG: MBL fold metallo-hydrolase, partial [Pseudomonadota bacterium]
QSGAQNVAQNGSEGPAPDPSAVLIEYVTHSTYRITTPGDVVVATDYFGTHGRGRLPDIVTMNHAHETHFTSFPDPDIAHVLRGWNPFGDGPAAHLLELRDIVVRNVPTDIRSGISGRETDGNSIFVFEVGELCIGHLGHLHHLLSENHYAQLGRIDVVMAPVDGTFTLNVEDMISILKRLRSRVVLPMHAFGSYSMRLFLDGMSDAFRIAHSDQRVLRISATTLPEDPTVIVLANHFWRGGDD